MVLFNLLHKGVKQTLLKYHKTYCSTSLFLMLHKTKALVHHFFLRKHCLYLVLCKEDVLPRFFCFDFTRKIWSQLRLPKSDGDFTGKTTL